MAGKPAKWAAFPHDAKHFIYAGDALKKAWPALHAGDTGFFGALALQVGERLAQVGVEGERLLHQAIEPRVVIEPPPMRRQRCAGERCVVRFGERRARGRLAGDGFSGVVIV